MDEEEARALFDRYFARLMVFFQNRGIPREDSRDLTQETLRRVYKNMGRFRGQSNLQTWIYTIARNVLRDAQRAGRHRSLSIAEPGEEDPAGVRLDLVAAGGITPEEEAQAREYRRIIRGELGTLPPRMRHCLLLWLQGFKYEEIAVVMQISLQAVRSHLFQGRKRLKECLLRSLEEQERGRTYDPRG